MRRLSHLGLAAVLLAAPAAFTAAACAQITPGTTGPGLPTTPLPDPSQTPSQAPLPAPGTTTSTTQNPAGTPTPLPKPDLSTAPGDDAKAAARAKALADSIPSPGENLNPHIKPGSEDDVAAIGTRNIGGRGLGNWYSTDWEIRVGKQYSMEIEKSAHLITDPGHRRVRQPHRPEPRQELRRQGPFHHQGHRFRRDQRFSPFPAATSTSTPA